MDKRTYVLEELRKMPYGSEKTIPARDAFDLFPPQPKPTAVEVALDISRG